MITIALAKKIVAKQKKQHMIEEFSIDSEVIEVVLKEGLWNVGHRETVHVMEVGRYTAEEYRRDLEFWLDQVRPI